MKILRMSCYAGNKKLYMHALPALKSTLYLLQLLLCSHSNAQKVFDIFIIKSFPRFKCCCDRLWFIFCRCNLILRFRILPVLAVLSACFLPNVLSGSLTKLFLARGRISPWFEKKHGVNHQHTPWVVIFFPVPWHCNSLLMILDLLLFELQISYKLSAPLHSAWERIIASALPVISHPENVRGLFCEVSP